MKRLVYITILICSVQASLIAQKSPAQKQQQRYYRMVDDLLSHTVDEISVNDSIASDVIFLDSRSEKEYKISHIENARYVGYDDFDLSSIEDIDKTTELIVYCSVGYRSEKVAQKLKKAGYSNVKNLIGGVFDWTNQDKTVVDSLGNPTEAVHGYNPSWGKWLTKAKAVY
ncbi:MAG: rhodanese-like domain-containing protein [Reichenbachiella sp.]|uniref:rhodanese-like domain-containing protein n=1 Tax=Reichenbachiella sp. TaxID=2184521 RepID=UPI0032643E92